MGDVFAAFSMSLDGYIAGQDEDFQYLFKWYTSGDTAFTYPNGMHFKVSSASKQVLEAGVRDNGALVCGRRLFDLTNGWNGKHPLDVPIFVVTHHPPERTDPALPFTFVTDGVASAINQAKQAAGDKQVAVASATIVQQCLNAGLLDGIHIDLVPFVLGSGIRLFEHLAIEPISLERTEVVVAPDATQLTFRIVK